MKSKWSVLHFSNPLPHLADHTSMQINEASWRKYVLIARSVENLIVPTTISSVISQAHLKPMEKKKN